MTVIYKDVKTLTEIGTVTGQQTKALVMYDTSTGAAEGLDVEVLIGMGAGIEALESAVTISVEGITATDVNGALAEHQADIETLGTEKANAANPVFSGNVVIPDADADNEAVSKGQMDTADGAYYAKSVEMIAHDATAPSPVIPTGTTKTYEFSTGGECAWITGGAVTVEVGDMVLAAFTEPSTWVYAYQNVLKRKADLSLVGDIEAVLDVIIEIQESIIGES